MLFQRIHRECPRLCSKHCAPSHGKVLDDLGSPTRYGVRASAREITAFRARLLSQDQHVRLSATDQCHTFLADRDHPQIIKLITHEDRFSTDDRRWALRIKYHRLQLWRWFHL